MSKQVGKRYWRVVDLPNSSRILKYGPFDTFSEATDICFPFCVEGSLIVFPLCVPFYIVEEDVLL